MKRLGPPGVGNSLGLINKGSIVCHHVLGGCGSGYRRVLPPNTGGRTHCWSTGHFGQGDHEVWSEVRVMNLGSDHNHVYRLTG